MAWDCTLAGYSFHVIGESHAGSICLQREGCKQHETKNKKKGKSEG